MPQGTEQQWANFLAAMVLALVRLSGMVVFAPFFSSTALPIRTKAVFVGAVAYLLALWLRRCPGLSSRSAFLRCWASWPWAWSTGSL